MDPVHAKGTLFPLVAFTDQTPYLVVGLESLRDSRGGIYSLRAVTALCRCGASDRKPYCDGAHAAAGFPLLPGAGRQPGRVKDYRGSGLVVHDNRSVCSHDASCIRLLPAVFRRDARPWILPDAAHLEEVLRVVDLCPSGALGCSVDGKTRPAPERPPEIIVKRHGPLNVRGGIPLLDDAGSVPYCAEHYALCRCGRSENIPFCDGSHFPPLFRDG